MAREVGKGLRARPLPSLPCKYFYDDRGSALFDAITRLPGNTNAHRGATARELRRQNRRDRSAARLVAWLRHRAQDPLLLDRLTSATARACSSASTAAS
jgi:hypothetical protein